jgi:hypothetical protein
MPKYHRRKREPCQEVLLICLLEQDLGVNKKTYFRGLSHRPPNSNEINT